MSFDLNVHRRDGKGNIIETCPYTLVVTDGKRVYEQPSGSKNYYLENGQACRQDGSLLSQAVAVEVSAPVEAPSAPFKKKG